MFQNLSELRKFVEGRLIFPPKTMFLHLASQEACAFAESLMMPRPEDRPGAEDALRLGWLRMQMSSRESNAGNNNSFQTTRQESEAGAPRLLSGKIANDSPDSLTLSLGPAHSTPSGSQGPSNINRIGSPVRDVVDGCSWPSIGVGENVRRQHTDNGLWQPVATTEFQRPEPWEAHQRPNSVRQDLKLMVSRIQDDTITREELELMKSQDLRLFSSNGGPVALANMLIRLMTRDVPLTEDELIRCRATLSLLSFTMSSKINPNYHLNQEVATALVACLASDECSTGLPAYSSRMNYLLMRCFAATIGLRYLMLKEEKQGIDIVNSKVLLAMDLTCNSNVEKPRFTAWLRRVSMLCNRYLGSGLDRDIRLVPLPKVSRTNPPKCFRDAKCDHERIATYGYTFWETLFLINEMLNATAGNLQLQRRIRNQFKASGLPRVMGRMESAFPGLGFEKLVVRFITSDT